MPEAGAIHSVRGAGMPRPRQCMHAIASAKTDRPAGDAGRRCRRLNADHTGSRPGGRRQPHPAAGRRAADTATPPPAAVLSRDVLLRRKEPCPFALEHLPVDQRRQLPQPVPRIDHAGQRRAQQIVLFPAARAVPHGQNRNCRVSPQTIQNPAGHGEKTATLHRKIKSISVFQCELSNSRRAG
jgi:hypothetical protein